MKLDPASLMCSGVAEERTRSRGGGVMERRCECGGEGIGERNARVRASVGGRDARARG